MAFDQSSLWWFWIIACTTNQRGLPSSFLQLSYTSDNFLSHGFTFVAHSLRLFRLRHDPYPAHYKQALAFWNILSRLHHLLILRFTYLLKGVYTGYQVPYQEYSWRCRSRLWTGSHCVRLPLCIEVRMVRLHTFWFRCYHPVFTCFMLRPFSTIQRLLLHGVFSLADWTGQGPILLHIVPWASHHLVTKIACHGRDIPNG